METINVELPATLNVSGARKLEGTLDLSALPDVADYIQHCIKLTVKRLSLNASAQMKDKTMAERLEAEKKAFESLLDGSYKFGSGGAGGARLTDEDKAFRAVMVALFESKGVKKSDAEKRVKKDSEAVLKDFLLLELSQGKEKPATAEQVEEAYPVAKPQVDAMVQAEVERMKALNASVSLSL